MVLDACERNGFPVSRFSISLLNTGIKCNTQTSRYLASGMQLNQPLADANVHIKPQPFFSDAKNDKQGKYTEKQITKDVYFFLKVPR